MYLHVRYNISVFIVTTCSKSFILISVAVSQQKHGLLSPISAPSVCGVSFLKMIELVGLFPWNTWGEQGERFHHTDTMCMPPSLMLLQK